MPLHWARGTLSLEAAAEAVVAMASTKVAARKERRIVVGAGVGNGGAFEATPGTARWISPGVRSCAFHQQHRSGRSRHVTIVRWLPRIPERPHTNPEL